MPYESHGWVKTPLTADTVIWRYFKAHRFSDLLETSTLHFSRFDRYPDPWEGVLPPETVALAKDRFRNEPIRPGDELTDFEMLVRDVNRTNKLCSYANCWFENTHESDGMWRLYGRDGIAVRSSFARLCASVSGEREAVHIGEVRYFDFRTEQPPTYGNTIAVAFYKRKEFEHERELRGIVEVMPDCWKSGSPPYEMCRDTHPKFQKVAVDLGILIESVHTAPGCFDTLSGPIREALDRVGLNRPILPSVLDERPRLL